MKLTALFSLSIQKIRYLVTLYFILSMLSSCDQVAYYYANPQSQQSPEQWVRLKQRQLTRGVHSDLTLLMSELHNDEQADLLRDLLEGLVIYDRQGNIQAGVAERWESADNKTWYFYLRPNAKWSSGESVIAQDFVASWQQLANSTNPLRQYLRFINLENAQAVLNNELPKEQLGIHALNTSTLELKLDKPTPYLPQMLAHAALLPTQHGMQQAIISNGAYQFDHQQQEQIHLLKNSFYWNQDQTLFTHVIYQKIKPNQEITKFDWIKKASSNQANYYLPTLCTYFYEFNLNHPILAKRDVRAALVSLISPQHIIKNEKLMAIPANEFLPQHFLLEEEPSWSANIVEPLLQQAGISETHPLHLQISYENTEMDSHIANRIIRAWSQSDLIRPEAQPLSWQQLQEKHQKGDFQLIRSGWCADYNDPSAFFQWLHSTHVDNKNGLHNNQIDRLLAHLVETQTDAQRTALYGELQKIVKQERIFLPIFQYQLPVYADADLKGFDNHNPTGVIYSKDLQRQTLLKTNNQ